MTLHDLIERYAPGIVIGALSLLAAHAAIVLGPALLTGCATAIPGLGPNLGVIEDPSLRSFLRPLALIADQGCTLTVDGRPYAVRCRVFEGLDRERIAVAYDLVTDRPIVALLLHQDGRQEVLWQPARQERAGEPEVEL